MSTRAQILFTKTTHYKNRETGKEETFKEEAQLYRHFDGYPEGVLEDLKEFYEWNKGRNNDVPYTAANFIYFIKRIHEEYEKERDSKFDWRHPGDYNLLQGGYGVESANHQIHGDEDYLYRITVMDSGEWIIEIAKLDYMADNQTFDSVKYQYKGTLDELMKKFGGDE